MASLCVYKEVYCALRNMRHNFFMNYVNFHFHTFFRDLSFSLLVGVHILFVPT